MAIEDAAALGILFSPSYFTGDIEEALSIYEEIRLPRVTKIQSAAAKAAYNINERIGELYKLMLRLNTADICASTGFSSNTTMSQYKVEDEKKKLTIEEMNA